MIEQKHIKHYLVLLTIFSVALFFFFFLGYNRQAQEGIIIATAAAYILWGVIHHLLEKNFHWRILVEYIVVALLASTAIIFLLLRA